MKKNIFLLLSLLLFIAQLAIAQDQPATKKKDVFSVIESDSVPIIDMGADTVDAYLRKKGKNRKKKQKKNVFYGLKTSKAYTKSGFGDRETMETFRVLKKYQEPNFYVPEVYVFDITDYTIKKVNEIPDDKKRIYRVLHGPYQKFIDGELIEEGVFYIGTKHARWERYDKNFTLMAKVKYFRGWPKDAKIEFWDNARKRPKEVIPYDGAMKEGDYFLFSENGMVRMLGQYENNVKVGKWVEYFNNSKKRLREIQYQEDPYAEPTEPVILKEWNEKGNLVIVNGKAVEPGSQQEEDPIKKRLKRRTP
jgi:antitoxin component YwqK of YwqJK toxin-antitoxin module